MLAEWWMIIRHFSVFGKTGISVLGGVAVGESGPLFLFVYLFWGV